MLHKSLAGAVAAAVLMTAFSVLPADAAKKGKKRYPAQQTTSGVTGPSLDGRTDRLAADVRFQFVSV